MSGDAPIEILTVNAGSSSVKLRLLAADTVLRSADLTLAAGVLDPDALAQALDGWPAPAAVGHRIVHGGRHFTEAALITPDVRDELAALTGLAPLHQPKSLAALDAVTSAFGRIPAVACFDTAFHHTIPAAAATYAIPAEWTRRWGIRRFGFHGLSHSYCAERTAQLLDRRHDDRLRLISCHLGAGASLAAIFGGRSVDTTMGFTPLDGLVMATRSGGLDPGLVLWLADRTGLSTSELTEVLEKRSGLFGLCGSADLREVVRRAEGGYEHGDERDPDQSAELALSVYVHSIVRHIGALSSSLGGLDALAFTGGVGENSAVVRQRVGDALGYLGVRVDLLRNADVSSDRDISDSDAPVRVLVVRSREDLQLARQTRRVLTTTV